MESFKTCDLTFYELNFLIFDITKGKCSSIDQLSGWSEQRLCRYVLAQCRFKNESWSPRLKQE